MLVCKFVKIHQLTHNNKSADSQEAMLSLKQWRGRPLVGGCQIQWFNIYILMPYIYNLMFVVSRFYVPSKLYRSFWRHCFQFCGTFTGHRDEMPSQALPPIETARVQGGVRLASLFLGRLIQMDYQYSSLVGFSSAWKHRVAHFSKPRWAGAK